MKRFFLIILLSWAVCITNAASLPFTVKPVKWSKLAKNNTDGVNIRKAPSATAPRYVYQPNNEPTCDEGKSYWSAEKLKGNEHAISFQGQAPVLSEVDGWYELKGIGPYGSNGWVSAKYCDVVNLKDVAQKVVPGKYWTPNFRWGRTEDGAYYGIYQVFDEMDGYCTFYVGREIDGFVVCPYRVSCAIQYDNDNQGSGLYRSEYYTEDNPSYILLYGEDQSLGWMGIDLRMFPIETIVNIIETATPINDPVVIYRSDGSYVAEGIGEYY